MVKNTRKSFFGGSASSYVANTVGGLSQQLSKALGSTSKSNTLTGGARRRRKTHKRKGGGYKRTKRSTHGGPHKTKTRKRTGGFLGSVISSAIVPFGLWGAQRKLARRIVKKSKK